MYLTIKTDSPVAEIGLYDAQTQVAYEVWQAHRQLAETIHYKIKALLEANRATVTGIIVFKGPGSFTGLRIGASVANAMATALQQPITGQQGEGWIQQGVTAIENGVTEGVVVPEYGSLPRTTVQKK